MNDDCLTPDEKALIESGTLSEEEICNIIEEAITRVAF